jgi:hypothetical protein
LLAEFLHCWNLRESLQLLAYSKNPFYWGITAAMILAGGLIAWIYFGARAEAIIAVHIGVSTPLIPQKLVTSAPDTKVRRTCSALEKVDLPSWAERRMLASEDTQAAFADGVNVAAFFLTNSCTLSGSCPVSVRTSSDVRSKRPARCRSPNAARWFTR